METLSLLLVLACTPAPPASVTIDPDKTTLAAKGATAVLVARGADMNGQPVTNDSPVTWASTDPTVATVDAGTVTAVGTG